jgi:predicted membrane protein
MLIEEVVGFIGFIILIIALLQSNIKKLRIINIISAIVFFIQSTMYESLSLCLTNIFIMCINIYMIKKIKKEKQKNKLKKNIKRAEKSLIKLIDRSDKK